MIYYYCNRLSAYDTPRHFAYSACYKKSNKSKKLNRNYFYTIYFECESLKRMIIILQSNIRYRPRPRAPGGKWPDENICLNFAGKTGEGARCQIKNYKINKFVYIFQMRFGENRNNSNSYGYVPS